VVREAHWRWLVRHWRGRWVSCSTLCVVKKVAVRLWS